MKIYAEINAAYDELQRQRGRWFHPLGEPSPLSLGGVNMSLSNVEIDLRRRPHELLPRDRQGAGFNTPCPLAYVGGNAHVGTRAHTPGGIQL